MHSAPRDEDRITQAIRYLIQHAHSQPTLAQLASTLNLSEYHLQRLFTQWAGISPKRFLQQITLEAAKAGFAARYGAAAFGPTSWVYPAAAACTTCLSRWRP